jgi:hypothetical protein
VTDQIVRLEDERRSLGDLLPPLDAQLQTLAMEHQRAYVVEAEQSHAAALAAAQAARAPVTAVCRKYALEILPPVLKEFERHSPVLTPAARTAASAV